MSKLRNEWPRHERLLLDLTEEEFQIWRHHPVTAAYLQYLEDQLTAFRTAACDLLEAGNLDNPDVLRGRMLTLRELSHLTLADIKGFYRNEATEGNDAAE